MHDDHLTANPRHAAWRAAYPNTALGPDVAQYLRHKVKRLTVKSYRGYEFTLGMLAITYPETPLSEFEPPAGTRLLEDFLADNWAARNPKTYNINLSVLRDFFRWNAIRYRIKGDPTLPIERGKARPFHRTTFTAEQREAIFASTRNVRYRLAVRLLLDYGIRKGALASVRLEHFDRPRQRLTIFTKGETIHVVPIPDPLFWDELDELEAAPGCQPNDYLMCKHHVRRSRTAGGKLLANLDEQLLAMTATTTAIEELDAEGASPVLAEKIQEIGSLIARPGLIGERLFGWDPTQPLGEHGLHSWWYRRLSAAGVVVPGTTRGQRMHKARHSAAQRVFDESGDIVATQHFLGHSNVATTQTYVGHETDQLHDTMAKVLGVVKAA